MFLQYIYYTSKFVIYYTLFFYKICFKRFFDVIAEPFRSIKNLNILKNVSFSQKVLRGQKRFQKIHF